MNFLIKIEDAINNLILLIAGKLKLLLPHFFFEIGPFLKKILPFLKHWIAEQVPKIKISLLKFVGYIKHYIALAKEEITTYLTYLRSDEFKQNKSIVLKKPFKYCLENPLNASVRITSTAIFIIGSFLIFTNTKKVIVETKKLRAPASANQIEYAPENEIELKNHKFEIAIKTASGNSEHSVSFDIKMELFSKEVTQSMEKEEKKLEEELEKFQFNISALPVSLDELKNNEKNMLLHLNHSFAHLSTDHKIIKKISLTQSASKRPVYFGQEDRMYKMTDIVLQIFLEDTSRNKQVYFDYTVLASNRNIVLFFKDNELKIRDRLSTQVEPILPRLPIEDEGKTIIKDKIRFELNEMLKEENIEGRVLEVYLDYIMGS